MKDKSEPIHQKDKRLQVFGENVEEREPLCTAGGNANWFGHCGTAWRFLKK